MNEEKTNTKVKKGGTPSESVLRQKIAPHADEIIQKLLELMRSRNPSVSLGAANTLLKKIVPDLKSLEVGGEMGEDGKRRAIELLVNLGGGFIPPTLQIPTASVGSTTTLSASVQSASMASEGEKNMDSSDGDSETGTR